MSKVPFTLGVVGHFGLAVRNPQRSAKWFGRVLGLRKEFEYESGIAVGNDNVTIALFKGKPSPRTFDHMSFHLPNMKTLRKALQHLQKHKVDLEMVRIPKGKSQCPYHSHAAESELYVVVSGRGSIRDKDGSTIVTTGDVFFFQPGEAHQLTNAGEEDFVYYVIADNPRSGGNVGDSCYYPDSGKWAVAKEDGEEVIVKGKETDYFDGEE